jgi:uncharacterized protein YkwD
MVRKLILALTSVVVVISVGITPAGAAVSEAATSESAFVADINALRADRGLPPLQVDTRLVATARAWAAQMARAGAISHTPNLAGTGPAGWQKLGENVGVGVGQPGLHAAFVNSSEHYANLVDSGFNAVGIGVVMSGGRMWVAEEFMQSTQVETGSPAVSVGSRKAKLLRYWAALGRKANLNRFTFDW